MTPYGMRRLQAALLIGGLTLFGAKESPAQPPADAPKLADYFGFQPLEIYKLERRIGNLMIRDLDGDKTGDIIVGNNARSRIDLLLSTKRPADEAESRPFRKEANDLEFDRRMRLVSIPVNKEVVSIGHRRLQRRRQARPGLLRNAGRGGDPLQRGPRPVRRQQEDQHRRGRRSPRRAGRRRPRPGRPRRHRPAGRERPDLRLPDRIRACSPSPSACRTPRAIPGCSSSWTSTATEPRTW